MRKKQSFTLLEIMIVICLIGLIGGVISYNMKGSLEEGKAFRTEQAQEQLHDVLMLEVAKGNDLAAVVADPVSFLKHSGLVKNPKKLVVDGWGQPFDIRANGDEIVIKSLAHRKYQDRKERQIRRKPSTDEIASNEE